MPLINPALPWKASAQIIKTGITAETETTSTLTIPAGWPIDRSFLRLASDIGWLYGGWHYLSLERTSETQATIYHLFHDIYNNLDYSSLRIAAEIVMLSRRPKSIQHVSKSVDLSVNGNRLLTSALGTSVNPNRAIAFLNSRVHNAVHGHLGIAANVTASNTLTWDISAQGQDRTRTLRAVVVDP